MQTAVSVKDVQYGAVMVQESNTRLIPTDAGVVTREAGCDGMSAWVISTPASLTCFTVVMALRSHDILSLPPLLPSSLTGALSSLPLRLLQLQPAKRCKLVGRRRDWRRRHLVELLQGHRPAGHNWIFRRNSLGSGRHQQCMVAVCCVIAWEGLVSVSHNHNTMTTVLYWN